MTSVHPKQINDSKQEDLVRQSVAIKTINERREEEEEEEDDEVNFIVPNNIQEFSFETN
jgi:hypothetical protein